MATSDATRAQPLQLLRGAPGVGVVHLAADGPDMVVCHPSWTHQRELLFTIKPSKFKVGFSFQVIREGINPCDLKVAAPWLFLSQFSC